MDTDVLIAGGGAVGTTIAYELACQKADVTLVDNSRVGSSSLGNAGIVAVSKSIPMACRSSLTEGIWSMTSRKGSVIIKPRRDHEFLSWMRQFVVCSLRDRASSREALYRLNLFSNSAHQELAIDLPNAYGYEQRGWLHVYRDERTMRQDLGHAEAAYRKLGVRFEAHDSVSVRSLEPTLTRGVIGGIHYPDDAHLRPDVFVDCMANRARELGARILKERSVQDFRSSGSRVSAVETTAGVISCKWLVIAAGVWSKDLGRRLGVVLPIEPAKGYSVALKPNKTLTVPVMLREPHITLAPLGPIIRATTGFELAGPDTSVNQHALDEMVAMTDRYLDGVGVTQGAPWVGFRPMTPDDLPIIGRLGHWENVLACVGHGTLGITHSPGTARLISNEIVGIPQPVDMRPFRADRFQP